jgi:3-oxoacyl-[acyl-carrier protein] reductase
VRRLAERTALVTGGGRGIGRAICVLLGRLGARVVVNYRQDEASALETASAAARAGGDAIALRADVGEAGEADRLVEQTLAHFGSLDVLVVNHGIWKRAPLETMTDAQWDETIRTNLTGAWAICRAAARWMAPRGAGTMVLVASTAGQRGEASHSHYAATKGALIAFTKSLAAELAPAGIRVNGVAPGWVLTDMTRAVFDGPEGPGALAKIPLGRPASPEEIAGPVAFLASDLASYMYGEVLCVNGGAVMVD